MSGLPENSLREAVRSSKAPAIARAAAIMRLLGRSEQPLSLQAIARDLGLVPSTCLYVLRALVEEGLVGFEPATKRYMLGAGVLALARQWLRRDAFHEHAQPLLDAIAANFDVTTIGVEIVGIDHIIAVAVSQGTGDFRLSTQIGSRFPALISATGRCIAAFGALSGDMLATRFARLRWDDPPTFEQWLEQVEETRRRGFAVDDGHYLAGVVVLAAPVWKGDRAPSHALVATALNRTLDDQTRPALAQALLDSAAHLSRQLGLGR